MNDLTAPPVGSILLGTTNAEGLRTWYRNALAPGHTGDGPINFGGVLLVIDQRDDVDAINPQPGRTIINFHADDIDAVVARLDAAGAQWISPVEVRPAGRFGTFADPDGNYLQLIKFTN
jgi:catechol 2,3-dioxygenase-like lactoylglutathione lyase family enzyme